MNRNNQQKLSLKNFLQFSFFLFPFSLLILVFHAILAEFFGSSIVLYFITYIVFSAINYWWGRTTVKPIFLFISGAFGLVVFFLWLTKSIPTDNLSLNIAGAIVIYLLAFIIFQFIQFITWVPFPISFLWQNRKNLDTLNFK